MYGLLIVCRVCVGPLAVFSARLTPDGFLRVIGRVMREVAFLFVCVDMSFF